MRKLMLACLTLLMLSSCAKAEAEDMLEQYLWQNRLIMIFAPNTEHPQFIEQTTALNDNKTALKDRDVVIMHFIRQELVRINGLQQPHISTNPFYDKFEIPRDAFTALLIGKDGEVKLRETSPINIDTLKSTIDAMPMRKRELNNKK